MLRPRIIPSLLLHKNGLVKTLKYRKPVYVGDPINAIRIFNEKEVDELLIVDIDASKEMRNQIIHYLNSMLVNVLCPWVMVVG